MKKTTVVNMKTCAFGVSVDDVQITRGTQWGNPFVIGPDGNRDQVCDKYRKLYEHDAAFLMAVRRLLSGKRLGCVCKPLRCHGDWLAKVANGQI